MSIAHMYPESDSGLAQWVKGKTFGGTVVEDASEHAFTDEDGAPAIYLRLVLSDPAGQPSWPVADVLAMQEAVLMEADARCVPELVYISIEPHHNDVQEDDDELHLQYG